MLDYRDVRPGAHSSTGQDIPLTPQIWTAQDLGGDILWNVAAAHAAAGFMLAGGSLAGLALAHGAVGATAVLVAVSGGAISGAGLLALALGRRGIGSILAARLLLPMADLAACCAMLWALGIQTYVPLLFFAPVCVATLFFSWRSGLAVAALATTVFAVLSALRGAAIEAWAPATLALAGMTALLVLCFGVFASRAGELLLDLREQVGQLERERGQRAAEQRRLLEVVALLEDGRVRFEHERALVDAQLMEVAGVAQRAGAGDVAAAQSLRPGMYGPLDALAGAVVRLAFQAAAMSSLRMHVRAQQRALDALTATAGGQARLLEAADTALRELDAEANRLVADVQAVERGSGELPGIDRHELFRALRGVERQAMTQASNTAILSAGITELRMRQTELESELRRLDQLTAAARAFESSGIIVSPVPAAAQPGAGSVPPGSGVFAASDLLPRETLPWRPSSPRAEVAIPPAGGTPLW